MYFASADDATRALSEQQRQLQPFEEQEERRRQHGRARLLLRLQFAEGLYHLPFVIMLT